jgi:hypothetical protein
MNCYRVSAKLRRCMVSPLLVKGNLFVLMTIIALLNALKL